MTLARYDIADLQRLISEEVGSGDFVAAYLKSAADTLARQPAHYRGYGPYWWPLKRLLINAGYTQFGRDIDDDAAADALTYPTDALTAAAAYAFAEHAFSQGTHQSPAHVVTDTEGEQLTYYIGDETMEGLQVAHTVIAKGGMNGEA